MQLEVTAAARDLIISEGYDPQYGARPMRRAIQRLIQDPLALKLINGEFPEGATILVDRKDDTLDFVAALPAARTEPVPAVPERLEA